MCSYLCTCVCTYVSVCLCVCCVWALCVSMPLFVWRAHVHSFNIHVLSKSAHEIYSFFLSSSTCANNLLKVIRVCVCVCLSLFLSPLLTVVCVSSFPFFFLSLSLFLTNGCICLTVCVRVCRLASWLNTVCGPAPDATWQLRALRDAPFASFRTTITTTTTDPRLVDGRFHDVVRRDEVIRGHRHPRRFHRYPETQSAGSSKRVTSTFALVVSTGKYERGGTHELISR